MKCSLYKSSVKIDGIFNRYDKKIKGVMLVNTAIDVGRTNQLRAAFHCRVFSTCVYARKSLTFLYF